MSIEKSRNEIGGRIYSIRKAKNLTQHSFATSIGIKANTLSDIERGKYQPSEIVIKAITLRYTINEHWLLTGEGEMLSSSKDASPHHRAESECCIPPERRQIIKSVIKVLDSGTIYAGALEQNILAFEEAVDARKAMDDLKHENAEIKETLVELQAIVREQLKRSERPPPGGSSEGEVI